jgi:hypothetical protein
MENQLLSNGNKSHRRETNIYSTECRPGDEAGGRSDLEVRRSHEVERLIESKSGWVDISVGECQKTKNKDAYSDIEKKEASVGPKVQSPLEAEVLATERTEGRTDDLRRDVRGGWKPVTIISGDIEGHHRNKQLLR